MKHWRKEFKEILNNIAFGGSANLVKELVSFVEKLVIQVRKDEALKWHKLIKQTKKRNK